MVSWVCFEWGQVDVIEQWAGRTTVVAVRLDDDPAPATGRLLAGLPRDERSRAATLSGIAHHHFVHGRALLRQVLAGRTGRPPTSLRLARGANGKPVAADPGGAWPAFNLAHSHGHVVVAVAEADAVGVDVEPVRPLGARLVRRALGAAVADEVTALPPDARAAAAIHHWVVREACAKALALDVAAITGIPSSTSPSGRHAGLRWDVVGPWPGVTVAVARTESPEDRCPPTVRVVRPAELRLR